MALQTVVLSQLDSLRRELITIARDSYAAVTFAKASLKVVADVSSSYPRPHIMPAGHAHA